MSKFCVRVPVGPAGGVSRLDEPVRLARFEGTHRSADLRDDAPPLVRLRMRATQRFPPACPIVHPELTGAALVVATVTSVIYIVSIVSTQFQTLVRFTPVGIFRDQISSVPADSQWGGIAIMALVTLLVAGVGYSSFAKRDA